jgi:hypothetical protein
MRVPDLAAWALAVLTAAAAGAAEPAKEKPTPLEALRRLEGVEILSAILGGEPPGPGHGWFHTSQSVYSWKWLAEHMDADHDGVVTPEEFAGPRALFDRLDRDGDGRLTADDFDWSDESPYWKQAGVATRLLRRADADNDGKLTAEEWQALFKEASKGKDGLSADDLRRLLFPPQKPSGPPSDMPSTATLLFGLLNSEIGSVAQGPVVGDPAPGFTLRGQDDKKVSLDAYRGDKPLVLVFGSFT